MGLNTEVLISPRRPGIKNKNNTHYAAIAMGSNMGNRVAYIEQALGLMKHRGIEVLSVSHLYRTKPMYYEDQHDFVNGACYVKTELEPLGLLDVLQSIENDLGRIRTIDKGPRTLDLDILLYDNEHILNERLEVPHKLMLEREFVLRPLSDILPEYRFPPSSGDENAMAQSVSSSLSSIEDASVPMHRVAVLTPFLPLLAARDRQRKTTIMSVLNITPDSFSDGGRLCETDLDEVKRTASRHIAHGATILDIGGQSTRPNARLVPAEQELKRILPVIGAIRSIPEAEKIALSVDTFYSLVAEQAIKAGADIINDVSGGLLDQDMFSTVAKLGKTVVIMHMRGNPLTMSNLTDYPEGVVNGVAMELEARVLAARKAGIYPWRIILDPGIGFAKTQAQNLELIKDGEVLRHYSAFSGIPWLWGLSKKGFIGKITGVREADHRGYGTAAGVTASIAAGADIVRVHNVKEMGEVVKMADAIYRQ